MTILLYQDEVNLFTRFPFERLPLTERKQVAIKVLINRGDVQSLNVARMVETNIPQYQNFAVVAN